MRVFYEDWMFPKHYKFASGQQYPYQKFSKAKLCQHNTWMGDYLETHIAAWIGSDICAAKRQVASKNPRAAQL